MQSYVPAADGRCNVSDGQVSFERDVKPLFRERDRGAMMSHFDLWSYDDVSENADSILKVVEEGAMPCDSSWDADRVETFRRWAEGGRGA
jgi:hypothetical protein